MANKFNGYGFVQLLADAIGDGGAAVKALATDVANVKEELTNLKAQQVMPTQQAVTVVSTFQALAPHPLPCWKSNGVYTLRNAAWHINNTADYTIKAGTAFATGMSLKPNTSHSVVVMLGDGTTRENTLAVNSTGKSLSFTADQSVTAASFIIFICEEAQN